MPSTPVIKKADRPFLGYIFLWLIIGLVVLTSASGPAGYEKFGDTYFFIKRQIIYGLIPGVILFLVLARVKYEYWRNWSWVVYLGALLLLVLVFVPGVGMELNGSRSWLSMFGYNFQPSEMAKLGLIVMAAALLSNKKRDLADWQNGLLPVLAILAPAFVLVLLQPDVGTLSIMALILFAMLFVARVPKIYLFVLGGLCGVVLVAMVFAAPYRMQRLTVFLHPELDPQGVGYHINQAFLAIGSGGFWGLGLGHSRQKLQYLPEVSADSVFAVMAEELGFLFAAGLVVLILAVVWRGLKIAKNTSNNFGRLLVIGIITWLAWQSFLNIGAMVGILPLTGVPLPFVSHGGSALMTALAAAGIVANVSREN